jgi:transcription elongation factor GreA
LAIEKVFPMTQAGKDKLIQELEHLKSVKRKEVVERIKRKNKHLWKVVLQR